MAPVEIMLSTILCAVPAFKREDPASTSAPTSVTIGGAFQWRVAVAGERNRARSIAAGVFDGGDGERRASAGGDAQNNVTAPGLAFLHFLDREGRVVFAGFGGSAKRLGSSSHDELHGAWIGIESWRDLRSIESADAAAGSSSDVDEASAFAQSGDDYVNGARDLRQRTAHGGGNG
jgi:hypothetical protein